DGALARLATSRFRNSDLFFCMAMSPDGKFLAAGSIDGIRLFEMPTGKEVRQITGDGVARNFLGFSPDGSTLAALGNSNFLAMWDVATGKVVRRFNPARYPVWWTSFSGDGKTLVTGNETAGPKTVLHTWDLATGKQLGEFEPVHTTQVHAILSGDAKLLACWGQGGNDPKRTLGSTVQLWDTATGKELYQLRPDQAGDTQAS